MISKGYHSFSVTGNIYSSRNIQPMQILISCIDIMQMRLGWLEQSPVGYTLTLENGECNHK